MLWTGVMVDWRWSQMLCYFPQQEVLISPSLSLGWPCGCSTTGSSRSVLCRPGPRLLENCGFLCLLLGIRLPCWEGPKPHRGQQPSICSHLGEPCRTFHTNKTPWIAAMEQTRGADTAQRRPVSQVRTKCFKPLNFGVACSAARDNWNRCNRKVRKKEDLPC